MAQPGQLPRPMVARAARLHADQTGIEPAEERDHLAPTQRSAHNNPSRFINSVYLKNVLGQINADSGNLHSGWLLLLVVADDNHTLAPRCREREPSTPSVMGQKRKSAATTGMSVVGVRTDIRASPPGACALHRPNGLAGAFPDQHHIVAHYVQGCRRAEDRPAIGQPLKRRF